MGEKETNQAGEKMLAMACEAYGIGKKHVFTSNYYPESGEAVIVTHGGAKVRYKRGDEKEEGFVPLTEIQVDGKIRKKMKPITGAKKKKIAQS